VWSASRGQLRVRCVTSRLAGLVGRVLVVVVALTLSIAVAAVSFQCDHPVAGLELKSRSTALSPKQKSLKFRRRLELQDDFSDHQLYPSSSIDIGTQSVADGLNKTRSSTAIDTFEHVLSMTANFLPCSPGHSYHPLITSKVGRQIRSTDIHWLGPASPANLAAIHFSHSGADAPTAALWSSA